MSPAPTFRDITEILMTVSVYNSSTVVVEAHDKKKPAGSIEGGCCANRSCPY